MNIAAIHCLRNETSVDQRGSFTKVFRLDGAQFDSVGPFIEFYCSMSKQGVVRGVHFQEPPFEHVKLVTCVSGKAFDCVIDIRKESPTYSQAFHASLLPGEAVIVPKGCAHGFCAVSEEAVLLYHVTSVHSPQHDAGIHWTSASVPWPVMHPLLSERDRNLPHLRDYISPF